MNPYYERDGITIYHGDCREILPTLSADVMVTDPPYGVSGAQNSATAKRSIAKKNAYGEMVDSVQYVSSVCVPAIALGIEMTKRAIVTPGNRCLTLYPPPDSFGVIYQPASVGLQAWGRADAQPIFYYGKSPNAGRWLPGSACSFVCTERASSSEHPCAKPYELWKKLVLGCIGSMDDIVLDPFMGSGTTMRACKDFGLRAIGIEIEERYCEIAAKRLAQGVLAFP